jgi:alkylhydroperoxidase family enzyme
MVGHTTLAKMQKMDPAVISALRNGTAIPDFTLEALHRFATLVVKNRGWVSDGDTDAFIAAGYTRRNVLEVILGVATKVMSNYTNHIVHTQLDATAAMTDHAGKDISGECQRRDHARRCDLRGTRRPLSSAT